MRKVDQIVEAMPHPVCAFDADGCVEYCNTQWRNLFGARVGDAAEPAILEHLNPDDRPRWLAKWHDALGHGASYRLEHRIRCRNGESVWHIEHGTVIGDCEEGSPALVVLLQASDRRAVEDELRALLTRKEEFMATLLHELRNPLAPIVNALALLGRHADDPDVVIHARNVLQRQVHQITRLVDDLFDLSRIQRGNVELRMALVDVAEVVAGAIEAAQPLIDNRRHALHVMVAEGRFVVHADPARLAQVLTNLLVNAAKYTNQGGCISVAAEHAGRDVLVHIRDSGVGIAREQLDRVFEMFAQVSSSTAESSMGGLGIGLAVARQLMLLQGGSIRVRSEGVGQGCEFTIALPRADAPSEEGAS